MKEVNIFVQSVAINLLQGNNTKVPKPKNYDIRTLHSYPRWLLLSITLDREVKRADAEESIQRAKVTCPFSLTFPNIQ